MNLFKEFYRVLKQGGFVFASLPHDANMSSLRSAMLARSYQEPLYKHLGYCKHHSFISVDLIRLFTERTGLRLIRLILIGRKWLLGQDERTVGTYSTWNLPLCYKLMSSKMCVILQKA